MEINSSKVNNFDLIRLFASLQVLFLHANAHLNIKYDSIGSFLLTIIRFFPGVPIFFTISGFLILWSYERNKERILKFYFNRCIRILPALWVCLILTIFILWNFNILRIEDFFSKEILLWVLTQASFLQFYTPDILKSFGVGTPNGSLWTISLEMQFYVLVPVLYLILVKPVKQVSRILNALSVICISICCYLFANSLPKESMCAKLMAVFLIPYLYNFVFGIVIYRNWNYLKSVLEGNGFFWLLGYVFYSLIFVTYLDLYRPDYWPNALGFIGNLFLSLTVISIAYTNIDLSNRILKGNDFSYGLYIYHMVVVNVYVELGKVMSKTYLVEVMLITFVLAVLSWFLIERPAMNWKKKINFR